MITSTFAFVVPCILPSIWGLKKSNSDKIPAPAIQIRPRGQFFLHNSLQSVTPLSDGYVKVQPLDIAASVFSRKVSTPNLGNLPPTFLCKICHPLFWGSFPPSIWDIDQPDENDLKLNPLVPNPFFREICHPYFWGVCHPPFWEV